MIDIGHIQYGVRAEGLSSGIPMTFIDIVESPSIVKVEQMVETIVRSVRANAWVCIRGKHTLATGVGQLVKDLKTCKLSVELLCSGIYKDPQWIKSVERVCVDHCVDGAFNFFALRNQDMVRFPVTRLEDLNFIEGELEKLKLCQAFRILSVRDSSNSLMISTANLAGKFEKTRVYQGGHD